MTNVLVFIKFVESEEIFATLAFKIPTENVDKKAVFAKNTPVDI